MARTDLPITPMPRAGLSLAGALPTAAIADGHMFGQSAKRFVRVKNSGGTPRTVTAVIPGELEGQPLPDVPYTIPATTGDVLIPPLGDVFRQSDGKVHLNYDDPAGLTIAVYELP
ncbi:hypothetical protein FXF51_02045 [Nonomuraea sp. PA05]|uniref:hypothetical protein n=1 Tax=Nonomuraea sp. PA05 TaxID=2604466 RepID=UPI0011D4BC42|nr:hypothetical protein [Nonomuraea sp. PA05]TYB71242.1 hypothetical protein FXF51_02045 [Nonomuraea sp. PA05]